MSEDVGSREGGTTGSARQRAFQLLGPSEKMRKVRELIARVADTDIPVLIRGESGTGKELVARAIHDSSLRRHKTFVPIKSAALPPELLEAELFGFERGAFTAAMQQKPGKFEFAHEGTIFLDEISDLHPRLQLKLLQVLQDGEFARLGGRREVRVDVRIVAATSRDLECAVIDGQFREDLFFRLNVVCITLPPLRQRRDDIPFLTERFLEHYAEHYNRPRLELAEETLRLFTEYEWPGNARELEDLVKRGMVLGSDESIREELSVAIAGRRRLPSPIPALQSRAPQVAAAPPRSIPATPMAPAPDPAAGAPAPAAFTGSLKDIARNAARGAERDLIHRTLQQTRWNRRAAAEILGVSYKALLYKIKEADPDKVS
jgi:two-component system, NtrC family, response regulator AtoC